MSSFSRHKFQHVIRRSFASKRTTHYWYGFSKWKEFHQVPIARIFHRLASQDRDEQYARTYPWD